MVIILCSVDGMPTFELHGPLDLHATLGPLKGPSARVRGTTAAIAFRTADGPATLQIDVDGHRMQATAWGPGADIAIAMAPSIVGDPVEGFEDPPHRLIAELWKRHGGVRIPRTRQIVDALLVAVCGQKVTGKEAGFTYACLMRAASGQAPGPHELRLPPDPAVIASWTYVDLHPMGMERRRAERLIRVARHRNRLEEAATMPLTDAYRRITAVDGISVWSAGHVGMTALGDQDAVPVGDYHLPNTVAWALTGEPRADDDRMLELLAPYEGRRAIVLRLLSLAGIGAPKYGPRSTVRSITRI